MQKIAIVLNNIRSAYNVGAITRTSECLGVNELFATGYTPYTKSNINTPPHILYKMKTSIGKTALGAEQILPVLHIDNILNLIEKYKSKGYQIIALEQHYKSKNITNHSMHSSVLLILGEEVRGIPEEIINRVDEVLEIPILGSKESYNVSVANGIALYEMRRRYLTGLLH